ncbi:RNA recognition motif domain [Cinara cedri]|uniref:RNA recognition motif domain n=1 Tax=Cinara cedri TaxID=506608 RepID=A0A5E4N416_9HEMI|nr:RNA recognition motif domain [Cinara cedri]
MAVSLFVGNLSSTVTLMSLRSLFQTIGEIASIKLCRDNNTGRSLGHGYVTFESSDDATRAIETMNCSELNGKPIEIAWSWRDPAIQKCQNANLYVKGLKADINAKCLYEAFTSFGELISCKVARDKQGVSKGYGYVQFRKEKDAEECIKKLNGMCIQGEKIFISKFFSKKDRKTNITNQGKFTNIYIKNLPGEFNDGDLNDMFEVYGEITSLKVMRRENGYSKRFGFVNFRKPDDAEKAVEGLNGKPSPSGKNYYVARAQPKTEREPTLIKKFGNTKKVEPVNEVNLYVKNLDSTVTDERLKNEFSAFGVVTSAKVMKGFGFVCFESAEQASNAIAQKNRTRINNNIIYVALAQKKADRLKNNYNKSHVKAETAKPEGYEAIKSPERLTGNQQPGLPAHGNNAFSCDFAHNTSPYTAGEIQQPGITAGNNLLYYGSAFISSPYQGTEMVYPVITPGNNVYYDSAFISSPYQVPETQHLGMTAGNNMYNCGAIYPNNVYA